MLNDVSRARTTRPGCREDRQGKHAGEQQGRDPLPRAGPAQDQYAKDAEADQQAHDADDLAHQRGEGEEQQPGRDPEVAGAARQQAEVPGCERDRQHGGQAYQPT